MSAREITSSVTKPLVGLRAKLSVRATGVIATATRREVDKIVDLDQAVKTSRTP